MNEKTLVALARQFLTSSRKTSSAHYLTIPRIALLALPLGVGACNRSAPPDAATITAPAPAASSALVGQWRNMDGTWRFQADGTFWFMGGTTIQENPSGLAVPRTESLAGTYQVSGEKLHLTLKQGTPSERESTFQIDGRKLTIDGVVYDQQ
jgi:hypothetical protein